MDQVRIEKITPSNIRFAYGELQIEVSGESYIRGHGSPDFVAYISSIKIVGTTPSGIQLDDETVDKILKGLKQRMADRKMTIEFEP